MSTVASHSPLNISETVREERGRFGSKGPAIGNSYGESNGHVSDEIT